MQLHVMKTQSEKIADLVGAKVKELIKEEVRRELDRRERLTCSECGYKVGNDDGYSCPVCCTSSESNNHDELDRHEQGDREGSEPATEVHKESDRPHDAEATTPVESTRRLTQEEWCEFYERRGD